MPATRKPYHSVFFDIYSFAEYRAFGFLFFGLNFFLFGIESDCTFSFIIITHYQYCASDKPMAAGQYKNQQKYP